VKSTEGLDIAAVFEANKVSQRSLDLLIPTVRKEGSEIWAEWNPEVETDPIDQLFRGEKGAPPGSIVRRVTWADNPFFPSVLRQEMEWDRKRDPEKHAHIWLGEYQRHSEARVFKNWRVEDFEIDREAIKRQGADWGYAVDPTVLVQCYIVGRTLYVPARGLHGRVRRRRHPGALHDGAGGGEVADHGGLGEARDDQPHPQARLPEGAAGGEGFAKSVEEGVAFLQSFDIVVHSRCQHVVDELTHYRYRTDPLTGKVLNVLEDKNNHCIDALRYACEGARRAKRQQDKDKPPVEEKPDYESVLFGNQQGNAGWMR
jgi:phage terminase large subunit